MLLPTVVYKAKHVYQNWTGGPAGSSFLSSDSGWFNSHTFSLWFTESFFPSIADREGKILLLGDNLGSHFNAGLVCLAKEKNVFFAMLPPNATHLLQPLDVAVFAPMKSQWRRVLKEYRVESRRVGDIPKTVFPRLLKLLWDMMSKTVGDNLVSGFRTCGLVPLDRTAALKKLPEVTCNPDNNPVSNTEETRTVLNESLMMLLKVNKNRNNDGEEKEKRGKRLPKPKRKEANVPPGVELQLAPPNAGNLLEVLFVPNDGDNVDGDNADSGNIDSSVVHSNVDYGGEGPSDVGSEEQSMEVDEEVCELCGKGDIVDSDDIDSSDDDSSIMNKTLEYEWETCQTCQRSYHISCLMRSVGTEKCIYCGFEKLVFIVSV